MYQESIPPMTGAAIPLMPQLKYMFANTNDKATDACNIFIRTIEFPSVACGVEHNLIYGVAQGA